ncbi:hypothetical protein ACHHYP_20499 [Achlya hypogyna]|uniref:Fungal lipase-type domain-containing protein n=1 Tax=Achlya hypogyna TaxID=1202772 RepID=A0A1V9ZI04_ACHHY|nr:hypothetical protein ACHHYP_20499 [Achlya hypogyna]
MTFLTSYLSLWAATALDYSSQWFPTLPEQAAVLRPNTTAALDMLCMCRSFATPQTHLADRLNASQCAELDFASRWTPDTNMSHLSPTALPVFVDADELVLSGTLRAKVFTNDANGVVIAFRHQEGEGILDAEMWEAMGLFGRNFVLFNAPSVVTFGSLLDYACRYVQYIIFGTRHLLRADFVPLAVDFTAEMRRKYPQHNLQFTGYSLGGALAQLVAVEFQQPATTFAANGILDIMGLYHMTPTAEFEPSQLVNYIAPVDFVPKLDCQIGSIVLATTAITGDPEAAHMAFVYGNTAWETLHQTNLSVTSGRQYSQDHGYCIDNALLQAPGGSMWDAFVSQFWGHVLSTAIVGGIVSLLVHRWRS